MGDRLIGKTGVELAQNQVDSKGHDDQRKDTGEQMKIPDENYGPRMAPMVQKRVRWARKPTPSPTIKEMTKGAWAAPGPCARENRAARSKLGVKIAKRRRTIIRTGIIHPAAGFVAVARPKLYPSLRNCTPIEIPPKAKPAKPRMAFPSPPASRRSARQGHPRKPRRRSWRRRPGKKKRMMGAEPVRGLNSRNSRANQGTQDESHDFRTQVLDDIHSVQT